MENKRTVIIVNKKTKEEVKITWPEALRYYEGYASFEELKKKHEADHDNKKDKRKRSIRNT